MSDLRDRIVLGVVRTFVRAATTVIGYVAYVFPETVERAGWALADHLSIHDSWSPTNTAEDRELLRLRVEQLGRLQSEFDRMHDN